MGASQRLEIEARAIVADVFTVYSRAEGREEEEEGIEFGWLKACEPHVDSTKQGGLYKPPMRLKVR